MGFIHTVISPVVVAVGFTSSSLNTELIFLSKFLFSKLKQSRFLFNSKIRNNNKKKDRSAYINTKPILY